ncbi:alpha/beta hydrolase [Brevundimonas subvibrioides]|uniref:alpha/beta hydrolase n=1 Tax=Brevundimonas subvibrioides TaxID=74313 RepID=UPI0032D592FC
MPVPDIFVWVSDGAPHDGRYPVLYAQDGQTLFEAHRVPFGVAWEMDRCASRLIDDQRIPPVIVVGVASTGDRLLDYAPGQILSRLSGVSRRLVEDRHGGRGRSGAYAGCLVEIIKPMIDRHFPTRVDQAQTFVVGASMGGVAAAECLALYPQTFGGMAAMSGHFSLLPLDDDPPPPAAFSLDVDQALDAFVRNALPTAGRHRIWLDRSETGLDQHYGPAHHAIETALKDRGYTIGVDLVSRLYPGVGHDEGAWRARLSDVLAFLLGPLS